jgi:hypothetical protein
MAGRSAGQSGAAPGGSRRRLRSSAIPVRASLRRPASSAGLVGQALIAGCWTPARGSADERPRGRCASRSPPYQAGECGIGPPGSRPPAGFAVLGAGRNASSMRPVRCRGGRPVAAQAVIGSFRDHRQEELAGLICSIPEAALRRFNHRIVLVHKFDVLEGNRLDRTRRRGGWGHLSAAVARQVGGRWTARSRRPTRGPASPGRWQEWRRLHAGAGTCGAGCHVRQRPALAGRQQRGDPGLDRVAPSKSPGQFLAGAKNSVSSWLTRSASS